jgi:hypothetical protein
MSDQLPPEIESALDNLRRAIVNQLREPNGEEASISTGMPEAAVPPVNYSPAPEYPGESSIDSYPGTQGDVPIPAQDVILPQLNDQNNPDALPERDDLPYPQMPLSTPPVEPIPDAGAVEVNPFVPATMPTPLAASPSNPEIVTAAETSVPAQNNNYPVFESPPQDLAPNDNEQSFSKARGLLTNVLKKNEGNNS